MTDKKKKQIIADRVSGMPYRKIAAKYGISATTAKNVCDSDPEILQKFARKKEQNTLTMLAFMESQTGSLQELVLLLIEAMKDPERMSNASLREVATAFGIVIDKIMACAPKDNDEMLQKARDLLGEINGVIR